jgi:(R,R)-butanediol dehydrogenase / meso-butanediol dehydrogenase / diacetyl reductase
MKAAIWHAQRDMRLEDIPEPVVGPQDVKIRVKYAGICHTDVFEYLYGPLTVFNPPLALGHELSGIVAEVGKEVKGIRTGERVTGLPYYPCWECHFCMQGLWNLCVDPKAHGMHIHGAFAEYVNLHYRGVYRIGQNTTLEEAATIEPLSVALRAISRAGLKPGQSVFIIGAGPIGLLLVMVARFRGVEKIIVSEPLPMRRKKAKELGATHVIDPTKEDPITAAREIADGLGADVSFDAVGSSATMDVATFATRKNGRVGILGFFYEPSYALPVMMGAVANELTYFATLGYAGEMKTAVSLVGRGELNPGAVISKVIPFRKIVDFFDGFEENRRKYLKILVEIG